MIKKYISFIYVLLVVAFFSCKKNDLSGNSIFLAPGAYSNTNAATISIDSIGASYTVSARTSNIVNENVQVTYDVSEGALEEYNTLNGTNYKVLPAEYYSFSSTTAQIAAGSVIAAPISLLIKSYKDLPDTNNYAIPVRIANVSGGNISVLKASETMFFLLKKILYVPAPYLSGGQSFSATYKTPFNNLTSWTFEWRVKMDAMNAVQALLYSYPSEVYTRFGDVVIRNSQLQIKTAGTQFSPPNDFQANIWYSFAITYDGANLKWYQDGNLILSQPLSATYNFSSIGFGNLGQKVVNEVRFWTIARTQSQIMNSFYGVNPTTPGLAGYWKCNEGSGTVFKDATANGNDLTASGSSVRWISNVRMPPY